jgi:cyclophilin family peptidyl-prolyl cis-trans isomerase
MLCFPLFKTQEWSPNGYDKAKELFERHFYDNSHFFRAVPKFLVQFGISYSKDKDLQHLAKTKIQDDPKHDPPIEFHPGIISYAGSGPNSRTSQLFISYGSAASLGRELWETPIGKVIEGMEAAEQFYTYGDMPRKFGFVTGFSRTETNEEWTKNCGRLLII